jgi:SAM-dependent methyltransferase
VPNQRAHDFAVEYLDLTRTASNEEELRASFNAAAVRVLDIRDLKLERNRQDLRRNRVILEFKGKGSFHGSKASSKFQEALSKLTTDYIPNQARLDDRHVSDYIGVCFDGCHLAFVFIEANRRIRSTELCTFDDRSAGALVLALERDCRPELTPQNVIDDFGPNSNVASLLLNALWTQLNLSLESHVNRVEMLYSEWNDLFEQSTSLGRIGKTRLDTYLGLIGFPTNADLTRVLFVLHTYHALFFKLLAAETVLVNTIIPGTRDSYCFGAAALDNDDLLNSLERDVEDSELFRQVNVLNFVEGSFFSWYLVKPTKELIDAIRNMMWRISIYRLNDIRLERTRDIVKRIYQQLVPTPLRHNIGEFFTPEWLVDFTLDRVRYEGSCILDKKILDPCCGSGNFLIHAIHRYKKQARSFGWDDAKILQNIIDHIFGFDLNPLAVLTARVNYLIAISDLISTHSEVEIPIYQADAIYAPTIINSGSALPTLRDYRIGTRKKEIELKLPESLIQQNRLFARVLEIMERTIRQKDSLGFFMSAVESEPNYITQKDRAYWVPWLRDMFTKVESLERDKWNRIWCRILRNYFVSVAVGKCDFVVGNPPWVRWSELPKRYRDRIKPTCDDYGIFSKDRYFGGNELDISGMITYTVADKWLYSPGGKLSFLITQTHFQSQSSGGFRRFEVQGVPLKVMYVDDFWKVKPFLGLGNKPTVLTLEKGMPTKYPLEYSVWERKIRTAIREDVSWEQAKQNLTQTTLEANPLSGPGQRWCILSKGRFSELSVLDGKDPNIKGRKGIVTDLNGAYFIKILGPGRIRCSVRFTNCPEEGRKEVPQRTDEIELDLVYPLIKGAENIDAFHATLSPMYVIVPNKTINFSSIPTASQLAKSHPSALRYFKAVNIARIMEQRSTWMTRQKPQFDRLVQIGKITESDAPFYAIYDVGNYTFAPYKVVWAEMAGSLKAAVLTSAEVPYGGGQKPVVPDHKVYFAAFKDHEFAHYICALLNSQTVRSFIDGFTIKIQVGTIFRHIRLPTYDKTNQQHVRLSRLSQEAHRIRESNARGDIGSQLTEINTITNRLLASTMGL